MNLCADVRDRSSRHATCIENRILCLVMMDCSYRTPLGVVRFPVLPTPGGPGILGGNAVAREIEDRRS
jgi:hypothetical protein